VQISNVELGIDPTPFEHKAARPEMARFVLTVTAGEIAILARGGHVTLLAKDVIDLRLRHASVYLADDFWNLLSRAFYLAEGF
jgi:hypothetical protein